MINPKHTAAFILCGGGSRRMGQDKSSMQWEGRTFLDRTVDAVRPLAEKVSLSTNDPDHHRFNLPIVRDEFPGQGPVAGIHSCLLHSQCPYNFILPCDCPVILPSLLWFLKGKISDEDDVTFVRKDSIDYPLIGIYRKRAALYFEKNLQNGQRRLMEAIRQLKHQAVDLPGEYHDQVLNINTIQEWNQLNQQNQQ